MPVPSDVMRYTLQVFLPYFCCNMIGEYVNLIMNSRYVVHKYSTIVYLVLKPQLVHFYMPHLPQSPT